MKRRLLLHLIILIALQQLHLHPAAASPPLQPSCKNTPVDIVLIIDRSLSMKGAAIQDAKAALGQFVDQMDFTADQVGLVSFNHNAVLDHDLSLDGEAIKQTVDALEASGNTDIAKAIELGHTTVLGLAHNPSHRTALILLSDGKSDVVEAVNAAQAAKDAGIMIISVGLDDADADLLTSVATSPALYYHAPTSSELSDIYRKIANVVTCSVNSIFLPILLNTPSTAIPSPDLIVEQVTTSTRGIEVTIKNLGTGSVQQTSEFWLDLYINPDPAPTSLNEVWYDGRSEEGLVWGITAPALPLAPGETLTLTYGDRYYSPSFSQFSGQIKANAVMYVQVDAVNTENDTGGVLERHEIEGLTYNNLLGPHIVTDTVTLQNKIQSTLDDTYTRSSKRLPARP